MCAYPKCLGKSCDRTVKQTVGMPHARQAVSIGAALQAGILSGEVRGMRVMQSWQAELGRVLDRMRTDEEGSAMEEVRGVAEVAGEGGRAGEGAEWLHEWEDEEFSEAGVSGDGPASQTTSPAAGGFGGALDKAFADWSDAGEGGAVERQ